MKYKFSLKAQNKVAYNIPPSEEPIGWDSAEFTIKRDEKWHGAFFNYSTRLLFLCGSAEYILDAYKTYGVDAQIAITIGMACGEGNPVNMVYHGQLNIASFIIDGKTGGVRCNIETSDLSQLIVNRRDIKVDMLSEQTFSGDTISPYLPFARIDNTNGLMTIARVKGSFDDNSNVPVLPDVSPVLDGIVYTTVPAGAGTINSCADPQHYMSYYYSLQFETLLDETEGSYLNPNIQRGNYDESECDNLGITEPPETPPAIIRARRTAEYNIKYCFCMDYLLFAFTDGLDLVSSGVDYDFDRFEIGVFAQIDSNTPFLISPSYNIIRTAYNPAGNVLNGCGGYSIGVSEEFGYAQGQLCFDIDTTVDLEILQELRIFIVVRLCGVWERPDISSSCISGYTNLCFTNPAGCCLEITEKSTVTYPNSYISGYMANEAFGKIIQNITDNRVLFKSNFFGRKNSKPFYLPIEYCDANVFLTNGYGVRCFPNEKQSVSLINSDCYTETEYYGRTWFLSLNDLFDGLNPIFNLGAGFETDMTGNLRFIVEAKEYFYQNKIILDLGEINGYECNLEMSYSSRFTFNRVLVGYDRWQNQTINGISEFNANRVWKSDIENVKNELDIKSDFIASGYTFELTRRENFIDTGDKDFDFDEDNFILFCNSAEYETPTNYIAKIQKGVDSPNSNFLFPSESINYHISPSANMMRWLNFSSIGLAKEKFFLPNSVCYRFESGGANYFASGVDKINCEIPTVRSENMDLRYSDGRGLPFIKPITAKFEFPLTFQQYNHIAKNPYGIFVFRWNGTTYRGYITTLQFKPNEASRFELLLAY